MKFLNILQKFSLKNLLLNRKRTISTMVGIILSTALICATCTLGSSFQATLVNRAVSSTGYYHIKLSNLTPETAAELKNNRDFSAAMTVEECGTAVLPGCQNESKPYASLHSMDQATFKALQFQLVEGHFPTNSREIVISKHMLTNGKLTYRLGQNITLEVGERQSMDGFPLNSMNPYRGEEDEQIVHAKTCTYTIVGMIDRPDNFYESFADPCYTAIITDSAEMARKTTVFLTLKNPYSYKKSFCELLGLNRYYDVEQHNLDKASPYWDYSVNRELLRWEVFAFSDSTVSTLCAVLGVVILIILFSSVFCIRNSFAIANTEKIRMYGMFASVGATKRQIRHNVIYEGFLLGIAAIPLGICSGILADWILIKIVNALLGDFLTGNLTLSVSSLMVLISVVLGFITIYFSALSSARRASRVSPIAQLRNTQDIHMRAKSLRIPRWVSGIFHTGGVLAYKNLKRSRKKYRTTVISLAVSIFTFITMNALLENAFRTANLYYKDYDYNLVVWVRDGDDLNDQAVSDILSFDYIEESHILYQSNNTVLLTDSSKFDCNSGDNKERSLLLLALDDASFQQYAKKIGANYQKVADKGILCDTYMTYDNDKYTQQRIYNYRKGDTIVGIYNDAPYSAKIGFVTDIKPYGKENSAYYGGYLILNKEYLENGMSSEFPVLAITIQSGEADALTDRIQEMFPSVIVSNLAEQARGERAILIVISIFLYGFITVITLIGVTNIFNTITSNMELRRREFAMLKSVGMTTGEFNRMIRLETLFYSVRAFLYGIAMSLVGTVLLCRAFSLKLETGMYLPIVPTIISGVFVFLFVFSIMKYSMSKINRQNIIETIRSENV